MKTTLSHFKRVLEVLTLIISAIFIVSICIGVTTSSIFLLTVGEISVIVIVLILIVLWGLGRVR